MTTTQTKPDNSPSIYTKCAQCEDKCTQDLKITDEFEYLVKSFGKINT